MSTGGASSARKAPPGQPWSHQETVALIDAYMEKWYALKRGQLRAQQWEEVAAAIAARCGLLAPPKTGTQCRHKVEKLRKRYRSELSRLPSPSPWPYFDSMDRLERGPLPISVRPPPFSSSTPNISDDDEDDEYEDDYEEPVAGSNIRSINGILREGNWGLSTQSKNPRPHKRRFFEVEQGEEEEEEEDDDDDEYGDYEGEDPRRGCGGAGALLELARVVRRFGEGFVRMEKRRMEMMREMEQDWMEMEAKRTEMVSESQRCIVETIASAFSSSVKKAKSEDNV